MSLAFQNPAFLWLLLLVPLAAVLPKRGAEGPHLALRLAALAALVIALARPIGERDDRGVRSILVVDRSASVDVGRLRTVDAALAAMAPPSGADERIVQSFGAEDQPLSIGEALERAERAIPEGRRGSVTLISDGLSVREDWSAALLRLEDRGLPLHVVPLGAEDSDLRPVAMAAEGELRVGIGAKIDVDVVGQAQAVHCVLRHAAGDLAEVGPFAVDGRKRIVLGFEPRDAGLDTLEVEIRAEAGADRAPGDETLSLRVFVEPPLRALYLGARMQGGMQGLQAMVGKGVALEALDPAAPDLKERLETADLAVVDDLPARGFPDEAQRALVSAVADHGLGLLAAGGNGAFGPGGWFDTPLASVLPVDCLQKEEKRDPSTTLVVIIDTSGSMGGTRIQLAKEVARLAIQRLLPHDKVGIVEFFGAKRWAAPIQPASNTIDIQRALNRMDAGGGTIILPAIEEAYYGIQNVDTRYKHVLVLTDGGVESGSFEPLLRKMAERGVAVSTVLVGPEAHSEFLVNLANWGKGRFYAVPDRFNLPEITLKQPTSARLPAWRQGRFELEAAGAEVYWNGIDRRNLPPVSGYVETRLRAGAELLAATRGARHPILSTWRFGLGRVTAFTSEPTGPGTEGYGDRSELADLLARVLQRSAGQERLPFDFRLERQGLSFTLSARKLGPHELRPEARLAGDDVGESLEFRRVGPELFEARGHARPDREILVQAGVLGRLGAGTRSLVLAPHSDRRPERQVDPAGAFDPEAAARAAGGKMVALDDLARFEAPAGGPAVATATWALDPLFFVLALAAFAADIAWRRRPDRRVAD